MIRSVLFALARKTTVLFLSLALVAPAYATPPVFNGNLAALGKPWYDVTAYGAKCDGSTDDSSAIQSANSAASSAGGVLYFPAKTCAYGSSSAIAIGTTESVWAPGANLLAIGSSTTDAFQIAAGGHPNTTIVLPTMTSFSHGAGVHIMPGALRFTATFQSITCSATAGGGGTGIEIESNASTGPGDFQISGTIVNNCVYGVEMMQASNSDSVQGAIVNIVFDSSNQYGLYYNTTSATTINPPNVYLNSFNLVAVDCSSVANSATFGASSHYTVPVWNSVNPYQFIGGCTNETSAPAGGSYISQYPQVAPFGNGGDPTFMVPQIAEIGRTNACVNVTPCATPPPSSYDPTRASGALGVEWNYTNGGDELDLFNTWVGSTPTTSFNFYQETSGSPTPLGSMSTTQWEDRVGIQIDGNSVLQGTLAVQGAASFQKQFTVGCNWGTTPACIPSAQSAVSVGWNNTNASGEADWVNLFNDTTLTDPAHNFYSYNSGVLTLDGQFLRNGNLIAQGTLTGTGLQVNGSATITGNSVLQGTLAVQSTVSLQKMNTFSCNWNSTPACIPGSQSAVSIGWNESSNQGEADWVNLFNTTTLTQDAHQFYSYNNGTLTKDAAIEHNGNIYAVGSVGWNGSSGPTLTSGSGAPTGACTAGAIYTRTDSAAAAGSEMYVCRNVAGTGTWEAVSGG